jgi:hypothetical protein
MLLTGASILVVYTCSKRREEKNLTEQQTKAFERPAAERYYADWNYLGLVDG